MKSSQLKLGRIKMFGINLFSNFGPVRLASILITCLFISFLFSCSTEVHGPEMNFPGFEFEKGNTDFTVEKTFEVQFPVENHIRVNLEAISGEVVVTGDNDTGRIIVNAQQYVGSDSQEDAEMQIDDLEVVVSESADEILIQTVQPKHTDGRKYLVEYDISVPSSFEVMVTQVNGDILIYDIKNSVDVSNVNGDIFLSNIAGGVATDVVNGNIEGTVALPAHKTIDLITNNGSIELSVPRSTSATFDAAIVNGVINTSNIALDGAVKTSKSLNGTLSNGEGVIELRTVIGNISIIGLD